MLRGQIVGLESFDWADVVNQLDSGVIVSVHFYEPQRKVQRPVFNSPVGA
jgi:hypothetical protein